jgi:hypothetical protein
MNQFFLRQDSRRVGTGSSLGLCQFNLKLTNEKQFSSVIDVRVDFYLAVDPQVMKLPTVRHLPKYSKKTQIYPFQAFHTPEVRILCNDSSR